MGDFQFIEHGYKDRLVRREAPKVIAIPERKYEDDDLVDRVSKSVRGLFVTDGLNKDLKEHIESITEPSSIENLMSGTVNLINTIIENQKQGKPVDTLLFLDKSARNGGYFFRLVWQELKDRGELPDGVEMPDIRFMNIGRFDDEKHHNRAPLELLKQKYRSEDFANQRVVVVDEYVASGDSLRRGLKTIEDVYGTIPLGLAQFRDLPSWYGSKEMGLLGVTDLEDVGGRYSNVKRGLDDLPVEEARKLYEIATKTEKDEFLSVVSKVTFWSGKNISPKIIHTFLVGHGRDSLQLDDIQTLCKIVKEARLASVDSGDVWQYIDSAGGFTSRRLDGKKQNENNRYYRQTLKAVVSSYMLERDTEELAKMSSET